MASRITMIVLIFSAASLAEVAFEDVLTDNAMPGWRVFGGSADAWNIENGILHCTGQGSGWMRSDRDYSDFILEFEYRLEPGGNSGVFLRAPKVGHISRVAMEVQILDDFAEKYENLQPAQYCGSVYKVIPATPRVGKPAGEWNRMRISLIGHHITVVHNRVTVVDGDGHSHPELLTRSARGPLGFQNHSSRVWYRNIRLANLTRGRETWYPEILTEKGSREHHLPDFSYAGYHWGEKDLPYRRAGHNLNVTDFGAMPNDGKDDTAGILAAMEAAHKVDGPVTVSFPRGRFVLREIVWIERGDIILRGAGNDPAGTVIEMGTHLGEMDLSRESELFRKQKEFNDKTGRDRFSPFSWMGGLIWSRLPGPQKSVFWNPEAFEIRGRPVTGRRGENRLTVTPDHAVQPGQSYRLLRYNKGEANSLLKHVFEWNGEFGSWIRTVPVHEDVTVAGVDGNTITLKEPLMHDIRPEWEPVLFDLRALNEVGIEYMRFECPGRKEYGGHHREAGYNVINLTNVRHGWIRDVSIDNADTGIKLGLCSNVTLQNVEFTDKIGSHYAIQMAMGCRNLIRYASADVKAIHTYSFNTGERGSVFTHCSGTEPHLDQHCGMNHQNLFDDIQVIHAKDGWSLFLHGGGSEYFPLHGAFNTFWNVRLHFDDPGPPDAVRPITAPSLPGPAVRLIGLTGNAPVAIEGYHPEPYIDGTNQPGLEVPSLYEYQLEHRLK